MKNGHHGSISQSKNLDCHKNKKKSVNVFNTASNVESYNGSLKKIQRVVIFFILQNVRIDTGFPSEYLELLQSSVNGSYHRVKALKEGLTLIDATLQAVVDEVSLPI